MNAYNPPAEGSRAQQYLSECALLLDEAGLVLWTAIEPNFADQIGLRHEIEQETKINVRIANQLWV